MSHKEARPGHQANARKEPRKAEGPPPPGETGQQTGSLGLGASELAIEFGAARPQSDESVIVERENAHLDEKYAQLEEMQLEAFLSQAHIKQVSPPDLDIEEIGIDSVTVRGEHLDGPGQFTLLWISYAGLEQLLVVIDSQAQVRDRVFFENRARVTLRDVVSDSTQEVIVDSIVGQGLSTYPSVWTVYRVTKAGKLRKLLTHRKSHSVGSKRLHWNYLNHFEFGPDASLMISTVHADCSQEDEQLMRCPKLGARTSLRYSPGADKFQPFAPALRKSGK